VDVTVKELDWEGDRLDEGVKKLRDGLGTEGRP